MCVISVKEKVALVREVKTMNNNYDVRTIVDGIRSLDSD